MKSFSTFRHTALTAAMLLIMPAVHAAGAVSSSANYIAASQADQTYDRFIVTYKDGTTQRNNSANAVQNVNAAIQRASLNGAAISSNGQSAPTVSASYQRKLAIGSDLMRTSRKLSQSEANALMVQLASDPAVAFVQPDRMMHVVRDIEAPAGLQAPPMPSDWVYADDNSRPVDRYLPFWPFAGKDMYYSYQWNFSNPTNSASVSPLGSANVKRAWYIADGRGVTVAVIDTGITKHSDLDTSLTDWTVGYNGSSDDGSLGDAGYDFIDDHQVSGRAADGRVPGGWDTGDWTIPGQCSNGQAAADSSWHGTHMAAVIGEKTFSNRGVGGIAYNAKVLPVRALGHCGGYSSDIADAIVWASGGHVNGIPDNTHVAQVINLSLGVSGQTCSPETPEYQAVQYAIGRGVTVVAAAGNDNGEVSSYSPANCPGVIAVASNGVAGKRAFYSNYGNGITLSAPGGGIYADDASSGVPVAFGYVWKATNTGKTTPVYPADSVSGEAGTAHAAAHVTGMVAMMIGARKFLDFPALSPAEVADVLTKSARPFPVREDQPIGAGIVDAYAAVNLALGGDGGATGDGSSGDAGDGDQVIALTNGVLLSGQSVAYPGYAAGPVKGRLYSIDVPAGVKTLSFRGVGGGGGMYSLCVTAGSPSDDYGTRCDFTSKESRTTARSVVVQAPQAGKYYLRVRPLGYDFSDLFLQADYNL